MKLIRIDRGGHRSDARAYETADQRFRVDWQKKQGARSCYRVLDRKTTTALRAFTLEEVQETIRDMLANDPLCGCGHRRSDHGGDYLHCRVCPHGSVGIASASYKCPHFVRAT